ncbi:contractile injection system protein, VgrG/Pvc8 family [Vibrio owensii]|uniref:contractile injection system protein, VgrG/Pvc8 family n=1 Tax=Vibrio owensii TaxID=696485 RepID=UPI0037481642
MKNADYQVLANAKDITALIRDRLLQLSVHDAAGEGSDTVSIKLDNRDNAVQFPATGATLDVHIGEPDALIFKGTFEVDELTEPLDDDTLTIHGKASKLKGSFKAPKDATFDDITLGDLVQQIAVAHSYEPAIAPELASIRFDHIDQRGESDMNLLTRLAREHGAVAKPVANRLVVVPKGQSKTVSGRSLPDIEISDPDNSSGQVTIQERGDYQSVTAYWFDEPNQNKVAETAGSGEPKFTIRKTHGSQEEAQAAADAKLKSLKRGKATLNITRPLTPEIVPEGKIKLTNHKESANGLWLVEEVDHVIEPGTVAYTTANCVTPN